MTDVEVTKKVDASQKEVSRESTTAMSKGRRQEGEQQRSAGLSQAKINVMKTMIYIVICFIVCWMPRNVYVLYTQFAVMYINSLMLYSIAHNMSIMPLFLWAGPWNNVHWTIFLDIGLSVDLHSL